MYGSERSVTRCQLEAPPLRPEQKVNIEWTVLVSVESLLLPMALVGFKETLDGWPPPISGAG